jgi:hypothetical protein
MNLGVTTMILSRALVTHFEIFRNLQNSVLEGTRDLKFGDKNSQKVEGMVIDSFKYGISLSRKLWKCVTSSKRPDSPYSIPQAEAHVASKAHSPILFHVFPI